MTIINIHGILANEFKPMISLAINKPKEVIDAICSNFPLFRNRVNELSQQGIHYSIIVDGESVSQLEQMNINKKPEQIDLVPTICGSGGGAAFAIGGGIVAAAGTGSAAILSTAIIGSLTVGQLLTGVGMMMVSIGLQMMMAPKPDMQRPESTVSAAKQSFMIGSKANLVEQGSPVPVGYGRLRIGSSIIQTTVKSYPQNYKSTDALAGTKSTKGVALITKSKE